jgi:hypothetical protein
MAYRLVFNPLTGEFDLVNPPSTATGDESFPFFLGG